MTPYLGTLQDEGYKVALVTDGRMSGASGKVPAAIHLSPEAAEQGPIARIQDGDVLELDAAGGGLNILVDANEFAARNPAEAPVPTATLGRNLFAPLRRAVGSAITGASCFNSFADTEENSA